MIKQNKADDLIIEEPLKVEVDSDNSDEILESARPKNKSVSVTSSKKQAKGKKSKSKSSIRVSEPEDGQLSNRGNLEITKNDKSAI